jgi:hypothetical protein
MFIYHTNFIGKVVRCSNIIPPSLGRLFDVRIAYQLHRECCYTFVYIITILYERLLDVRISKRPYRECW